MIDLNDVVSINTDLGGADELIDRLKATAADWVPPLFPRGRISADRKELRLADITGRAPRKEGSCKINLTGAEAGSWYDFAIPDGGGPISTIGHVTGLTGAALMERARELAGTPRRNSTARRSTAPVDRSLDVQFILQHSVPARDSLVETYLLARGLDLPPSPDILYHSSLTDWQAKIGRPAMVAVVRNPSTGEPTGGLHRTYLADDGSAKAAMEKPKMMLGPCIGGVVMLAPMTEDGTLGLAEGIESALAASKLSGGLPVWAGLSTSGMRNFIFPAGLKQLVIFADKGAAGNEAAEYLRDHAATAGIDATIALPQSDDDFAKDLELGLGDSAERHAFHNPAVLARAVRYEKASRRADIELIHFRDMTPRIDDRFIVDDMLNAGELSLLVGASGTAKTFFAVDLGLRVAGGQEVFGRATRQTGVIYIATEAGRGIVNRVCAYKRHYDMPSDLPFAAITSQVNLRDGGTYASVCDEIMAAGISEAVRLIIVDTLSRSMAGGDENSSADMGAFVDNMDALRRLTGAHVLIVHHLGKDQGKGARGHSSLRAAVDTEITVSRDNATGISTAVVTKQRELPLGAQMNYRLHPVELGRRPNDDRPVTSCVVEAVDAPPKATGNKHKLTPAQQRALDLLIDAVARHGTISPANNYIPFGTPCVTEDEWRLCCYAGQISDGTTQDSKRQAFGRAAKGLVAVGRVGKWQEWVWAV